MRPHTILLLDIEGTTTPISFVYDRLFPYARQRVSDFLEAHADEPEVRSDLEGLAAQAAADVEAGVEGAREFDANDVDAAVANVRWQMDNDRKTTALKSLQGKIWKAGYADGSLQGEVFDDVPRVMAEINQLGADVCIYSSGSIAAQKLLFGASTAGDLTVHIRDYFDTTTGPKKLASSYVAIADALGVEPAEVLFCTDNLAEAIAAGEARMEAVIVDRPGNADLPEHDFEVWTTLTPALERF